jgi:hypothetical protein
MLRASILFVLVGLLATACFASSVEVLYVAERQNQSFTLLTYNVNPQTAVATQVGTMSVPSASIDPLTKVTPTYYFLTFIQVLPD